MAASELRAVRRVLRGRRDRADASEVSYRIYLAVMLAIIVGAPLVRGLVLWNLDALPEPGSTPAATLGAALTLLTALCVLAGAQGGPARAGLPQIDLLYTSAIPRRRLLAAPIARAVALGTGVGMFGAGIIVATRLVRGDIDAQLIVALALGGAALGAFAAIGMLLGQLGRAVRWPLAAALAALAALQLGVGVSGDPWSWVAGLVVRPGDVEGHGDVAGLGRADSGSLLWGAGLLAVAALLLTIISPWIAARLRWEALREQAAQWDAIGVSAVSGDPKAALARLGAPVWLGRRWRLRPSPHLTLAIIARDLLGLRRTPARSLLAFAGVAAASAMWCLGLGAGDASSADPDFMRAAALGAPAMLLAYVALQSWCRGLATAADGAGSVSLLPAAPEALISRHLIVSLIFGVLASVFGAVAALWWFSAVGVRAGAPMFGAGPIIAASGVLVAVALSLRVLASLKGTIPMRILAPVPTPVGDASGINVLLWTLDGPIAALLLGAVLSPVWIAGIAAGGVPILALVVSAVSIAAVLIWARVRLVS